MVTFNELFASPAKPLAKPRNLFWDSLFYDVAELTPAEHRELSIAPDNEGSLIAVSPAGDERPIRHYESADSLLKAEGEKIVAVAVPGVGSSIVGSAALARTVANTLHGNVAAIVCGYGAVDLLQEALGGWFFYGYSDKLKYQAEVLLERNASASPGARALTGQGLAESTSTSVSGIPKQLDTGALESILQAQPPNLKLLLGHSKGSMLIDFVLERLVQSQEGQPHPLYEQLTVVTVSAVVGIPRQFKHAHQIIGAIDWFGGINSVADLLLSKEDGIRPVTVPGSWHHLNTRLPFALKLQDALEEVLAKS